MMIRLRNIVHIITCQKQRWMCWVLVICFLYYLLLLIALIVKFQTLPNYINVYNWFKSVGVVVTSTPSWRDIINIISEEWWLEIGFMNYDFGIGISEWSLFLAPVKIGKVLLFSALMVTYFFVLQSASKQCERSHRRSSKLFSGLGGAAFAFTSITMSWVVCCATPTWVVGLAILGLGVSTSLWLEPIGLWLNMLSFLLMMVALMLATEKHTLIKYRVD
ncbi:MAG: hypothetical protein ACI9D5_001708 [Candidatus Endobugula sp.]|jgi:hypothetical protein